MIAYIAGWCTGAVTALILAAEWRRWAGQHWERRRIDRIQLKLPLGRRVR